MTSKWIEGGVVATVRRGENAEIRVKVIRHRLRERITIQEFCRTERGGWVAQAGFVACDVDAAPDLIRGLLAALKAVKN